MATDLGHEMLADLLEDYPGWRAVLGEFGIDGRAGTDITLAAAAERVGTDVASVIDAMSGGRRAGIDCASAERAPLGVLIRHIEEVHHTFLRREFPRIARLLADRRGAPSPPDWLAPLEEVFGELRSEMEPHLLVEETVLFPMCRDIVDASSWPSFHSGPIEQPIRGLQHDHRHADELASELERLLAARGDAPDAGADAEPDAEPEAEPDDPDLEAIVAAVGLLNEDLRRHLVEENDLLFPQVVEFAAALDCG